MQIQQQEQVRLHRYPEFPVTIVITQPGLTEQVMFRVMLTRHKSVTGEGIHIMILALDLAHWQARSILKVILYSAEFMVTCLP